jgi:hypothetical protein
MEEGDVNNLEPVEVEEYENEDSFGISNDVNAADSEKIGDPVVDSAANEVVNQEDPLDAYQKKKRVKISKVWKDCTEVKINGVDKHQCNWCKKTFTISKSSCTSTLGRHLRKCLSFNGAKNKQKLLAIDGKEVDGVGIISNFSYDQRKSREMCSQMMMFHEYPFTLVEHVMFNKFIKTLTPYWERISRATAKKDCFTTYNNEKRKLKALLKKVHKVNITTDIWTSRQKSSYMVVTCHYIDSEWCLNRRVLNFFNVPPPHSGYFIANALQKSFQEWGIENKISSITVDNAKPNDTAIKTLRDVFNLRKTLPVDGKLFHVRCCAHITNLLVQDGLDEVTMIVDSIRDGIKYLVASEGRLLKFAEIAKRLQLPSKKLFLDVPTRWNSTYLMLAAALEFKEAFPMYSYMDSSFQWLPSDEDWEKN